MFVCSPDGNVTRGSYLWCFPGGGALGRAAGMAQLCWMPTLRMATPCGVEDPLPFPYYGRKQRRIRTCISPSEIHPPQPSEAGGCWGPIRRGGQLPGRHSPTGTVSQSPFCVAATKLTLSTVQMAAPLYSHQECRVGMGLASCKGGGGGPR